MRTETAREQYRREVVLLLVVVWDLSYQYAALALGVPIGTVMSRLFLAAAKPASHACGAFLHPRARSRILWCAGRGSGSFCTLAREAKVCGPGGLSGGEFPRAPKAALSLAPAASPRRNELFRNGTGIAVEQWASTIQTETTSARADTIRTEGQGWPTAAVSLDNIDSASRTQ